MQSSAHTLSLLAKEDYFNEFMLCTVFIQTTSSKDFVFAQGYVEKYNVHENGSYFIACCRKDKLSALCHIKIHWVLKK